MFWLNIPLRDLHTSYYFDAWKELSSVETIMGNPYPAIFTEHFSKFNLLCRHKTVIWSNNSARVGCKNVPPNEQTVYFTHQSFFLRYVYCFSCFVVDTLTLRDNDCRFAFLYCALCNGKKVKLCNDIHIALKCLVIPL